MHHKYQQFIILSTYRSGSVWLLSLLNSHPMVRGFGECFHPAYFNRFPHVTAAQPWFLAHVRDCFPLLFLRHHVYAAYPSNIHAVGFKLMYTQAIRWRSGKIWEWLRVHHEVKIIHLKRNNLLASYVSTILTLKTNVIMATNPADIHKIKITINPQECLKYFLIVSTHRKYYDKFFKQSDVLDIIYEDVVADKEKQLARTLNFLKLPLVPLTSPLIKLNTTPLPQLIKNYAELRRFFHKSEWSNFFLQ
ncbi:sulfotransferase [Candidatus Gottesmanbacteria bacterium]|nr:sulfotransferase [Candidatus Gottesmanbacteria bacterium]